MPATLPSGSSPGGTTALQQPGQVQGGASASPTTAAAAGLLGSSSWQDQIAGYLSGEYGGSIAQSGLGASLGSAQLGLTGPQLGVSSAEATNTSGYDFANALLGYEDTGLQSQALAEEAGTAAEQQGISQAEYGVSATQYPEQQQEAALANTNAQNALSSGGAASGVLDTKGQQQRVATQQATYGWQQADIYRQQQLAALGQQASNVGYEGQEEGIANARSQLGVAAQGQGLSAQQASDQLTFGLQQLGVNANAEQYQYLSTIANAQGAGAEQLAALGSQASLTGGLGPHFTGGG